jgi:hypothetical protein
MRLRRIPKPKPERSAARQPERSVARQLADRVSDGLHVQLLWHPADDSVSVAVDDRRSGEHFESPVPRDRALFAFNHPFAFAG